MYQASLPLPRKSGTRAVRIAHCRPPSTVNQSYIGEGIWRQGIGSFLRNSYVSTLIVPCRHMPLLVHSWQYSSGRLCTLIGVPCRLSMLSTFSTFANVLFQYKSPRAEGAKTDPPPGFTYEGTQTTAWSTVKHRDLVLETALATSTRALRRMCQLARDESTLEPWESRMCRCLEPGRARASLSLTHSLSLSLSRSLSLSLSLPLPLSLSLYAKTRHITAVYIYIYIYIYIYAHVYVYVSGQVLRGPVPTRPAQVESAESFFITIFKNILKIVNFQILV